MNSLQNYVRITNPIEKNILGILSRVIHRVVIVVTIALMTVMVLDVGAQVLYRYVLNHSLAWSDELGRYLFLWCVFLGATIGVKENLHPSFGSVVHSLPTRIRTVVVLLGRTLVLAFCVIPLFRFPCLIYIRSFRCFR
jgi:TRAP-type C4-dicarboxylate transport system permease small subunit